MSFKNQPNEMDDAVYSAVKLKRNSLQLIGSSHVVCLHDGTSTQSAASDGIASVGDWD